MAAERDSGTEKGSKKRACEAAERAVRLDVQFFSCCLSQEENPKPRVLTHLGFLLSDEQVIPLLSVSQLRHSGIQKNPAIRPGFFSCKFLIRNTVPATSNRTGALTCSSVLLNVLDGDTPVVQRHTFRRKFPSTVCIDARKDHFL